MIKLAIIEDDVNYSTLLTKLLNIPYQKIKVIFTAYNIKLFFELLRINDVPDIIIVDIQLPDGLGIKILPTLKNLNYFSIKSIALSSFDDADYVFDFLAEGGMGYLSKSDSQEIMIEAIKEVSNNKVFISTQIGYKIKTYNNEDYFNNQLDLSKIFNRTELLILELLTDGLFYKEIALDLNYHVDTIKKKVKIIYSKLNVSNRMDAILLYDHYKKFNQK